MTHVRFCAVPARARLHEAIESVSPGDELVSCGMSSRARQRSARRVAALCGVAPGLIACLAMSACTSEPGRPDHPALPVERFITNITPEGMKQFTFDLTVPSGSGNGRGHSGDGPSSMGGGRGGMDGPGGMGGGPGDMGGGHGSRHHDRGNSDQDPDNGLARTASKARDRMAMKLKETDFCASGYDELGENLDAGHFQISGRCKDQATDADRAHFPNTGGGG